MEISRSKLLDGFPVAKLWVRPCVDYFIKEGHSGSKTRVFELTGVRRLRDKAHSITEKKKGRATRDNTASSDGEQTKVGTLWMTSRTSRSALCSASRGSAAIPS